MVLSLLVLHYEDATLEQRFVTGKELKAILTRLRESHAFNGENKPRNYEWISQIKLGFTYGQWSIVFVDDSKRDGHSPPSVGYFVIH